MRFRLSSVLLVLIWEWAIASPLQAHDPGLSTAEVTVESNQITLTAGFAPADVEQLLPVASRTTAKWTAAEFARIKPQLTLLADELWDLEAGGQTVKQTDASVALAEGDNVSFQAVYPRPSTRPVVVRARQLQALPPGHRQFITVTDERGTVVAQKLLSAKENRVELPLGTTAVPLAEERPTFAGFLKLGIEHIWTGYDHLLFLFALLIVCRTARSIIAIISCFTIAHSLTLALATLNVVNVPSRLVEPVIALSIIYVGLENVLRAAPAARSRYVLTFAFGLIHGFGFAGVLRELGLGTNGQGLVMPLFAFNLGVEVGQIAIAAVLLPLIWQLRKQERFVRQGIPALSAVVALAGLWWLVERTLL